MSEQTKKPIIPKNAKKILAAARDPEASSAYTFVVDGREYNFQRAQALTDEQLINAIVIDRFGYYLRRGLQDVSKKHEYRHSSSTDWVKEEYKVIIEYIDEEDYEVDLEEDSAPTSNSFFSMMKNLFKK